MIPRFTGCRIAALFLSCLTVAQAASAHRDETQLWLSQSAATKLDRVTVTIDANERFIEGPTARHLYQARVAIDRQIAKGLEVGAGFSWAQTGGVNEYRPFQQINLTRGSFALRSRIEQRMFENADGTLWRLRERLQYTLPLDGKKRWVATLNGELMFNLNSVNISKQTGLTQFRTLVGMRRILSDQLSLTLSYQRQQSLVAGGEDVVTHQPIIALAVRF